MGNLMQICFSKAVIVRSNLDCKQGVLGIFGSMFSCLQHVGLAQNKICTVVIIEYTLTNVGTFKFH